VSRPRETPPAIVLGGNVNALSIARSLGRRGVPVHTLGVDERVELSRYVTPLRANGHRPARADWPEVLLGPRAEGLRGAVLLVASDEGIELLGDHRAGLEERYLLEERDPLAEARMLNKLSTYEQAREAGVATPGFRHVTGPEEAAEAAGELRFPLLVKPLLSHLFQQRFLRKFVVAQTPEELPGAVALVGGAGIEMMLVELVPGTDSLLCSYYTYMDAEGRPEFDFTKRNVRRHPKGMGPTTFHRTEDFPDIIEPSLRLLRHVGVRGLANIEFKLDTRDGQYKLIECNARFTAGNPLLMQSGLDLPAFVYARLTGRPTPDMSSYRRGATQWLPGSDVRAFAQLRGLREITLRGWLRDLARPHALPYFSRDDPAPSLVGGVRRLPRAIATGRRRRRLAAATA
jgi:D-aspartate ligase